MLSLQRNKIWFALRVAIGLLFVWTGGGKLYEPYQNFQYVLEGYQIVPVALEVLVAKSIPWVELFVGLFLVVGLWTRQALWGAGALFAAFVVVIGQALLRGIPLDECGCFGSALTVPPVVMMSIDLGCLCLVGLMLRHLDHVKIWSIDRLQDSTSFTG